MSAKPVTKIESRKPAPKSSPFVSDIGAIRARARKHIEDGAITDSYAADRQAVIKLLNEALATEIVCVLRYKRHYFMASGLMADAVKSEFLEHANEEQAHADRIAERIVQLGGEPDLNPDVLSKRSHAEYVEGHDLRDMVKEDLVAERIAIDSYREIINYIGDKDTTTKRMMEDILAQEEEHADELADMLDGWTGK
ncbi:MULTISPECIES: ferritin-like domain-containing protein [unclassified Lysobacter]|uniref:ferritin-like domain-containing protein n=1 Tax=unclassified Lysobacter TaxID=2635362 RepID=UPI001BE95125|nr:MULTISPECIES: ferritin-like domain-containing protein [unclassified Lysobacter]MBT2748022.1 bacterioferritin [Lysobacter sp. ISL-42]MBT2752766.1 bacterioferritin [Lysobacter sp. ISL-50]MBT2779355.1 bacterioferritin [Lysobacter sp. ISL-54]MBT2781910.1 bacterioferritin [Lysobacter sp. ISL-52]